MLGKYHKLFTDKKEIDYNTPVFINVGEWDGDEEQQQAIDSVKEEYPNRPLIVDNIPMED